MTSRTGQTLVSLIAVAVLATAGSAAAAPSWLAPAELVPGVSDAGPAYGGYDALAAVPDGTVVALTAESPHEYAGPVAMVARVRPPGGTFSVPQTLSGDGPQTTVGRPAVAVDAVGDAVAAWAEGGDGGTVVRAAFMPAGTAAFGPAQTVSQTVPSGPFDPPSVAVAGGEAIVVWSADGSVSAAIRPAGATVFGPAARLSASADRAQEPEVAVAPDGAATAVWRTLGEGSSERLVRAVRPPGGAFGPAADIATADGIARPKVAVAPNGRATIIWWQDEGGTRSLLTKAGGPADDLAAQAPGVMVADESPGDGLGSEEALAVDDQDTALVLYFDGDGGLRAATRPSGGAFSDTGPPLSPSAGSPRAAFAPGGEAIAAWLALADEGGPGLTETIQSAAMPRGGTFGAAHDVDRGRSTGTGMIAFSPLAGPAIDAEGNATVLYGAETSGPELVGDWRSRYEWRTATRDAGAPTVTSLSVPATATAGAPVSMSATASDRWTAAGITWTFGDGTAGVGGAGASHAFAAAGRYTVTATATDAVGHATSRSTTIQVAPAPRPPWRKAAPAGGRVLARWSVGAAASAVRSLSVASVRRGATVTVACTGGTRRGCPFARRTHRVKRTGSVSLTKDFRNRRGRHTVAARLRPGVVVKVVVTAPGLRGRTYRATVRRGRTPKVAYGCLVVGSRTRATAC